MYIFFLIMLSPSHDKTDHDQVVLTRAINT